MKTLLFLLALLLPLSGVAQTADQTSRIVVHTRENGLISGYYRSAAGDSLLMLSGGREVAIDLDDLLRVDRVRPQYDGMGELGLMLGYYGSIAHWTLSGLDRSNYDGLCEDCRAGYLDGESAPFFIGVAGMIPTGLIGYLIDRSSDTAEAEVRQIHMFDEDRTERRRQAGELDATLENSDRRLWSLDVRGGYLLGSSFSSSFESSSGVSATGYRTRRMYSVDGRDVYYYRDRFFSDATIDDGTSFLWVRRVGLHYRLFPSVEIGATVVNLSDPGSAGRRDDPTQNGTRALSVAEGVSGAGYLASGKFFPLSESGFARGLAVTGGIGIGSVKYHRVGYDEQIIPGEYDYDYDQYNQIEARTPIAALIGIEYTLQVSPMTSIGFYADYTATTSTTLPGTPELDVRERQVSAGTTTAGFTAGWRF